MSVEKRIPNAEQIKEALARDQRVSAEDFLTALSSEENESFGSPRQSDSVRIGRILADDQGEDESKIAKIRILLEERIG